jgi:group I intron endonuclease
MINKTGVYKITNETNDKIYYGSATESFKQRWNGHIKELNKNIHSNCHLQNAWNLYGADAFKFEIILVVDEAIYNPTLKEEILMYEQMCLDLYWDGGKECYNIRRFAVSPSVETCKKMGDTQRGKTGNRINKCGFTGVYWVEKRKKWTARISINGKKRFLGMFSTPEKASVAYQKAVAVLKSGKKLPMKNRNTSGYVGVYWHKITKKWASEIRINNKKIYLGLFTSRKKASAAYQNALRLIKSGKMPKTKQLSARNTSGFKGVSWDKKAKKWEAQIMINRRTIFLGLFNTPEEASKAYQDKLATKNNKK